MTRGWFLTWLGALCVGLLGIRLTLPPMGVAGPLASRLESISFALGLTIIAITVLVVLRLRQLRMNYLWAAAVFLWLVASEPLLRLVMGGSPRDGYPGGVDNWPELPLMILGFLVFLAYIEREPPQGGAMFTASIVAGAVTLTRPFMIVAGFDRIPGVGDLISLPGAFLSWMMRMEHVFNVAKGLFLWTSLIGNMALTIAFGAALFAAVAERGSTIPERLRA